MKMNKCKANSDKKIPYMQVKGLLKLINII